MDEIKKAKLRALKILTRMDKTHHELETALVRAGFSKEAVQAAIEYVASYGYLDDQLYAKKYIDCFKDRRSRQKIKFELVKKGVDKEYIEAALLACEDFDERQLIRNAIKKKWNSEEKPDEKQLSRLYGYLSRQGFSSHDIWQILREENLT